MPSGMTPFKPMPTVGAGAYEIRVRDTSGAYRAIYVAKLDTAIYVLHAFQKKSQRTAKFDEVSHEKEDRSACVRYAPRVKSSGNVFLDLGFDPAEAEIMALRAEVMVRLEQHLKMQGWTQAESAKRLGITQPRVSRLIKGKWQDFSLDMLLTLAARVGLQPKVMLAA